MFSRQIDLSLRVLFGKDSTEKDGINQVSEFFPKAMGRGEILVFLFLNGLVLVTPGYLGLVEEHNFLLAISSYCFSVKEVQSLKIGEFVR